FNACVEGKLCAAACPVGAISPEGDFNFSACYTHNYREFMGGFTDWVEQVADSKNARDYRSRISDAESASMWQSLSYGANYKAAYCRRSARPEKTSLDRSSPIGRHTSKKSCGPFKRRKRRFTSPGIPTLRITSPNGFPTKRSSTWATACGRTPSRFS